MSIERLKLDERILLSGIGFEDLSLLRPMMFEGPDGTVEAIGEELNGHLIRVGRNAKAVGSQLWGKGSIQSNLLFVGGAMHDIGKIDLAFTEPRLLSASRVFTEDETKRMKQHTYLGYNALRKPDDPKANFAAVAAGLHHHFKPENGNGFIIPPGINDTIDDVISGSNIKRKEIMQMVLTISVCDVLDAMKRPYVDDELRPNSLDPSELTQWIRGFINVQLLEVVEVNASDLSRITTHLGRIISSSGYQSI